MNAGNLLTDEKKVSVNRNIYLYEDVQNAIGRAGEKRSSFKISRRSITLILNITKKTDECFCIYNEE